MQMVYAENNGTGYGVIGQSALLTDELACGNCNAINIDERILNNNQLAYPSIHSARAKLRIAREALAAYAASSPLAPPAWQGELYALEGYAVLWFAELYCSGIPLTTVHLAGVSVPTRGFTTEELFNAAIPLFDSAMVLGADSASYVNLARVGKGRALLGLGQFAAADSAVAAVPTDFVYRLATDSNGTSIGRNNISALVPLRHFRVEDHQGGNGLVWSTDPRTGVVIIPARSATFMWPSKYNISPSGQFDPQTGYAGVPFRLADGLEARLIQAEAELARGDAAWLTTLNTLRSTCVGTTPCAPVPGLTPTSLAALTDPGSDTARVSLLMQERAMWLYLTGHREGDLRRLASLYHRNPNTLWPDGVYSAPAFPSVGVGAKPAVPYGTDVVFRPDQSERTNNPLYGGCYDLNP